MGMCVDMKVGESVIATTGENDEVVLTVKVEKKTGAGVRLVVTAPPSVKLTPPNKQHKFSTP